MGTRLTATDQPLSSIIGKPDSLFLIPRYQRNYAWSLEQITDFWNDLNGENETFFAGSIVVNTETKAATDGYAEVIDGQQRLTTSTILAAAIRDHFFELDREVGDDIQAEFIGKKDRKTKEYKYKLMTSQSLQSYFQKHIQKSEREPFPEKPKAGQETFVKQNYNFFMTEISKKLQQETGKSEKTKRLNQIYDSLLEMVVIYIEVNNSDEAYDIFETMNARGADLTVADLVKNYLFKEVRTSSTGEDFAKDAWGEIIDNLEGSGLDFTTFLRYHWLSKYEFLMKKRLFKTIKNNITDHRAFLKDLKKDSEIVKAFASAHVEDLGIFENHRKIRDVNNSLRTINAIGAKACYVLLLSIIRNKKDLGLTNAHREFIFLEKFIFYYHGVSGLPANRFEKFWSEQATNLNKITNVNQKHISKEVNRWLTRYREDLRNEKDENRFRESFVAKLTYRNNSKSRAMIRHLFGLVNSDLGDEEGFDPSKVDIEHILPQSPKKWKLNKKDIKGYVNSIGNLTLIGESYNKEMSNETIDKKILSLKKSKIKMNSLVVSLCEEGGSPSWNEEKIRQRTEDLMEVAVRLCDY